MRRVSSWTEPRSIVTPKTQDISRMFTTTTIRNTSTSKSTSTMIYSKDQAGFKTSYRHRLHLQSHQLLKLLRKRSNQNQKLMLCTTVSARMLIVKTDLRRNRKRRKEEKETLSKSRSTMSTQHIELRQERHSKPKEMRTTQD